LSVQVTTFDGDLANAGYFLMSQAKSPAWMLFKRNGNSTWQDFEALIPASWLT
jgi:hypothetical protein